LFFLKFGTYQIGLEHNNHLW